MRKQTDLTLADFGVIRPDELYPLAAAKTRLGWGAAAMRSARRNGLAVMYAGGRGYITGSEIIRYITEMGKNTK